jgi:hypothetical protein
MLAAGCFDVNELNRDSLCKKSWRTRAIWQVNFCSLLELKKKPASLAARA